MTEREYFGGWYKYIDTAAMHTALGFVRHNRRWLPEAPFVFKAFRECPAEDARVVMLGLEPYDSPFYATGLAFGNPPGTNTVAPSLEILRDAVGGQEGFDITLESWARQGVLLLNCALTVNEYGRGSHVIYWKPFIEAFLERLSSDRVLTYVLFGSLAKAYGRKCVRSGRLFGCNHPSWFARMGERIPEDFFRDIAGHVLEITGKEIRWV